MDHDSGFDDSNVWATESTNYNDENSSQGRRTPENRSADYPPKTSPGYRKPTGNRSVEGARLQGGPLSPVHVNAAPDQYIPQASSAMIEEYASYRDHSQTPPDKARSRVERGSPSGNNYARRERHDSLNRTIARVRQMSPESGQMSSSPKIVTPESSAPQSRNVSNGSVAMMQPREPTPIEGLSYHHQRSFSDMRSGSSKDLPSRPGTAGSPAPFRNDGRTSSGQYLSPSTTPLDPSQRPATVNLSTSELQRGRRTGSPHKSPHAHSRSVSALGLRTPDSRPLSYVDLLTSPYPQNAPAPTNLDNSQLRTSVGANASLLSAKSTLEMYRANIKKTNDPAVQYEFAVFMINAAREDPSQTPEARAELLKEARHILQRLSDKSYPFAQYYLADGYASGLFSKDGREDNERAFPLFVAASKHGHAEAGYRAALCYEFAWGTRKDPPRAVQFYRQSASKNHPGAMSRLGRACLLGDLGLTGRDAQREGLKWLKRAADAADFQYNSAPYDLGLLHETGFGGDVFQDLSYAAQLFTQSAELGHGEANYRLGDAYEHGKLNCPRDPALSVHFYTGAAQKGHALAMMALCAWYMVGAEPVLEKDESEAYEWAKRAAELGLPKAEYAVGYFTEMGIGCRRDPLEANVWYVRAADNGDERARHRIAAIRAAASGDPTPHATLLQQQQQQQQRISQPPGNENHQRNISQASRQGLGQRRTSSLPRLLSPKIFGAPDADVGGLEQNGDGDGMLPTASKKVIGKKNKGEGNLRFSGLDSVATSSGGPREDGQGDEGNAAAPVAGRHKKWGIF
ncbi:hypothetical protein MMC25_004602 [Agyrium rufum]|nr:hypothetical protein [Agyrium rufum]